MKKWVALVLGISLAFPLNVFAQEKKWYEGNPLVAHALGEVDGRTETNCKEAFENSWANGIRVVEADFSITKDGALVVRHDFDQNSYYIAEQKVLGGSTEMTLERFQNEKINYRYTSLTAAQLIQLLNEYPDMYLVTDTKATDLGIVKKQFGLFAEMAKNLGREDVLERVIPQIYNEGMYDVIQGTYPYKNYIYTLYQTQNPDYEKIGSFCVAKGIDVVTINHEVVNPNNIKKLTGKGLHVYAHTLNRLLDYQVMLNYGVTGIYTDTLKPWDLESIGKKQEIYTNQTLQVGETKKQIETITIFGQTHLPLREMAAMLKGSEMEFFATYQDAKKGIVLKKGEGTVFLGNEILRSVEKKGVIQKMKNALYLEENQVLKTGYFVDGEVYYRPEDLAEVLGFVAQKTETGYVFSMATK